MFGRIAQSFEGTTAIVIGAGGIGGEIVQQLIGKVAKLVVADRDDQLLESLLSHHGGSNLIARNLNVGDATAVSAFFAELDTSVGTPDYVFYTAGILNIESLAEISAERWETAVKVNLNGAFYCIQAAAERMKKRRSGSIIVLGSIAGTKARSGSRVNPVYNATKAGLASFVNAVAPVPRPNQLHLTRPHDNPHDGPAARSGPLRGERDRAGWPDERPQRSRRIGSVHRRSRPVHGRRNLHGGRSGAGRLTDPTE